MLDYYDPSVNAVVESVLKATEKDPYVITDESIHMWVDNVTLCIRINKIFSVDWANFVLESFYKIGRLRNQYILHIGEDNNKVFLIRLEDYESSYIYSVGDVIALHLSSYKVQESIVTFNDLIDVC